MIKYFVLIFIMAFSLGCKEKNRPERPIVEEQSSRPLVEESENGSYTEWYPGHQQKKISGRKDKEGNRTGIWKYFSEDGIELSITIYNHGVKDGHTIVRHPNGNLHYVGEYENGEPFGEWKFYNEDGELKEIKKY